MPFGKYYCDYCEKEFQDTQTARKRHLKSKPHLRAKSLWYSSSDPQVSTFAPKALCNRFVSTNYCPYGDSCRYLHPNNNNQGLTYYNNNNNTQLAHGGFVSQGTSLNRDLVSGRRGTSWFDLPPSLKPPPEHGYPQLPSIDWG